MEDEQRQRIIATRGQMRFALEHNLISDYGEASLPEAVAATLLMLAELPYEIREKAQELTHDFHEKLEETWPDPN